MKAEIRDILKKYWGYDDFRPLQEEIIMSIMDGKDTLALMPTGGGKSITYQIPALAKEGICIVITPLIALMKDQTQDLKKRGVPADAIYTGLSLDKMETIINKAIYNHLKILYISPERLASEKFRLKLKEMKVSLLAVDEAHCISQWGYDFRPSYLQIAEVRTYFPKVPILALTATAPPLVVEDIQDNLKFSCKNVLSKSFRRHNLAYIIRKTEDKLSEVYHILKKMPVCAIVFVKKRETAEQLSKFLNRKGIKADYYHAGLSSLQRETKQNAWTNNSVPVMVATNAFGMGIDKPDVRLVVHFDIPSNLESYFQEAGRVGRDGLKAYAVLICSEVSVTILKRRIEKGFPEKSYIKKVYEYLGNFFQIAEGSGQGYAFEFNINDFIRNFKLDKEKTLASLKILQSAEYLDYTTGVNSRSRVCFLISREEFDKYHLKDEFAKNLLITLMRKYPGIFTQYVFINEQFLAEELMVSRQKVYETLLELSRTYIIKYVPGNERPYIVYLQPRLPISYINISKDVYEKRKESYALKINSMIGYITNKKSCRQLQLIKYFGQEEQESCGICDVCLENKKKAIKFSPHEIIHDILQLLSANNIDVKELIFQLEEKYKKEITLKHIRQLLDEGKIYYITTTVLALKEK